MSLLLLLAIGLAGFIGVVGLIAGLVSAPWQILLLFLLVIWAVSQRLLKGNQNSDPSETVPPGVTVSSLPAPSLSSEIPSLHYRGAVYESGVASTTLNSGSGVGLSGKYRGCTWGNATEEFKPSQPPQQPTIEMKYRGVRVSRGQSINLPPDTRGELNPE